MPFFGFKFALVYTPGIRHLSITSSTLSTASYMPNDSKEKMMATPKPPRKFSQGLENVTVPRPFNVYPDTPAPKREIEAACELCGGNFGIPAAKGHFCPTVLPCLHGFCSTCTVKRLPGREHCPLPLCRRRIPTRKREDIQERRNAYAISQAAWYWDDAEHQLSFAGYEPLEKVDRGSAECRQAAKQATAFLRKEETTPSPTAKAIINMAILPFHLVVMANMIQALRAAEKDHLTPTQARQWSRIVAGVHCFLEGQARQQVEVTATALLQTLNANVAKLDRNLKPWRRQFGDLQMLFRYVVELCRTEKENSTKQKQEEGVVRRSTSRMRRLSSAMSSVLSRTLRK